MILKLSSNVNTTILQYDSGVPAYIVKSATRALGVISYLGQAISEDDALPNLEAAIKSLKGLCSPSDYSAICFYRIEIAQDLS